MYRRRFKKGLMIIIPLSVISFLLLKAWDITVSLGVHATNYAVLNVATNLALLMGLMYLIGTLVEWKLVQSTMHRLFDNVPVISWFVRFAFKQEEGGQALTPDKHAEAYVVLPCGIALQVIVSCEKTIDGRVYIQCYLASSPMPATGFSFAVEKIAEEKRDDRPGSVRVYYTGRTSAEYCLTVMSYSMK